MPGPIVTGPDGTRYRHRMRDCILPPTMTHHIGVEAQSACVDELPRIPGWPLPGPAPQFLTDGPKTDLRDGDWVLFFAPHYFTHHLVRPGPLGWTGCTLDTVRPGGFKAYLLARADPEADA